MPDLNLFHSHKVNWTKEKVLRFWDYMAENHPEDYWSKATGKELIDFINKRIPLRGLAIDYGCGVGFLLGHLLDKKIASLGIETSEKSALEVKKKFRDDPFFKGVFNNHSLLEDQSANFVFLAEVIEHLLPDELQNALREIHKILKPDGYLIVTLPHDENLKSGETICPDCGCIFHRMQHLRSFSAENLNNLISNFGFKKIFCEPVALEKADLVKQIYRFFTRKTKKHYLIYIGRK